MGPIAHNGYYAPDDPEALCRCDHVPPIQGPEHCLQSRESYDVSATEGFAQFFGTKLFNLDTQGDATLNYYKRFRYGQGELDYWDPPVPADAFGYVHWIDDYCTQPLTDFGVEWDWLNFFYKVTSRHASPITDLPHLYNIFKRACQGNPDWLCQRHMSPRWSTPPQPEDYYTMSILASAYMELPYDKYVAFNNAGESHGVAH
jgi:hypothetical protein